MTAKFPRRVVSELIHTGAPISVPRLAELLGSPNESAAREVLDRWCAPERDEHGAVTACGVSLAPTPISFRVAGRDLYTWCTLDTLVFPRWAGAFPAEVATVAEGLPGEASVPVSWRVTETGVVDASHPDLHIVARTKYGDAAVRCCFCNSVRTFVSGEAARVAQAEIEQAEPGATVLWSLAEAWENCEPLIDEVLRLPA